MSDLEEPHGMNALVRRLDELEIKVGFVDDWVEGLNRTLFRQQQQIDQLLQAVTELRRQLAAQAPAAPSAAPDERPPHY